MIPVYRSLIPKFSSHHHFLGRFLTGTMASLPKEIEPGTGGAPAGGAPVERANHPKCYMIVHNIAKKANIGNLARSCAAFGTYRGDNTTPGSTSMRNVNPLTLSVCRCHRVGRGGHEKHPDFWLPRSGRVPEVPTLQQHGRLQGLVIRK